MRSLPYIHLWHVMGWLLVGIIVYGSLTTEPSIPSFLAVSDKIMHFLAYFVTMAWFLQIYERRGLVGRQVVFLIVLGLVLELAQGFVEPRAGEWGDAAANTLGVLAGLWIPANLLCRLLGDNSKQRNKREKQKGQTRLK